MQKLAKKRVRQTWSDDEKRSICLQTLAPGVSAVQVTRRYAMNGHLIFKWLKDPRFQLGEAETEELAILPVEDSTEFEAALATPPQSMAGPRTQIPVPGPRIEKRGPGGLSPQKGVPFFPRKRGRGLFFE